MTTVSVTHQNLISAAGSGPREEFSYWLPQVIIIILYNWSRLISTFRHAFTESWEFASPTGLLRDTQPIIIKLNIGLFNLNTILIIYKGFAPPHCIILCFLGYHWINQLLLLPNSGRSTAPPIGQSLLSSSDVPIYIPPVQSITAYCYFGKRKSELTLNPVAASTWEHSLWSRSKFKLQRRSFW